MAPKRFERDVWVRAADFVALVDRLFPPLHRLCYRIWSRLVARALR